MNYLDNFTGFLLDSDRKLSAKAVAVVLILTALVVVDDMFSFSYSYTTEKQIYQVQQLNKLMHDPAGDSLSKRFAHKLRTDVMNRKSIIGQIKSFFRRDRSESASPGINPKPPEVKQKLSDRNSFWFNISAAGLYLICALAMIPVMLFAEGLSFPQRIATGIVSALTFGFFAVILIWLFGMIPKISSQTWTWNYIINALIQMASFILLMIFGKHQQKMKNK